MTEYEKEIEDLKVKMDKAKDFAEMLPCFKDIIISKRLDRYYTGNMCSRYKDIYFGWGVNRYFYKDNKNITNCNIEFKDKYLFNIYINSYHLYNSHNNYGLKELGVPCFFFDSVNTTFYIEEKDIEVALEMLNDWYIKVEKTARRDNLIEEKEKLEMKIKNIEYQLLKL